MPIRMKDIAKDLGLSAVTISKVLRNHPDIGEETRQRVLRRVDELDYRPNELARWLATGRSYLVGLVVPCLIDTFFAEVAMGLSASIGPKGYSLIVTFSEERQEVERKEVRKLLARRLDALVIASSGSGIELFEQMDKQSQPYVLIDRPLAGFKANFVGIDNVRAGLIATKHLHDVGRRRIAHIACRVSGADQGCLEGYKMALEQLGVAYRDEYVVRGALVNTHDAGPGYEAMTALLNLPDPPDSVFCHNDPVAIGAMNAIVDAGLRIPADVAVIGCGNRELKDSPPVPLSSVDQQPARIGERAGELVMEILNSIKKREAQQIILEPKVVMRASTSSQ